MENLLNSKKIQFTIVAILALSIGLYFRLYPLLNFAPPDAKEKATVYVISKLRGNVRAQVNQAYPNLPDGQKELLIKKKFDELLRAEGPKVRTTIDQVTKSVTLDENSQKTPYLLASDSFYYYGLTENIIETGSLGGVRKASKYHNPLMLAPLGHWEPLTLHPYVGLFIYKFLKIFNPNIELMYALSFTSIFLCVLSIIPFLCICSILRARAIPTLVGAIFLLLSPIYIKRSSFGWYDNDPYNVLFPLLMLACLFSGLTKLSNKKMTIIYGLLVSFLIMLYALFWQGWVFFFSIIFISGIFILGYKFIRTRNFHECQAQTNYFSVITLGSFLIVGLIFGFSDFFVLFKEGWVALKNFLTPQLSLWPDLFMSVGELHKASLSHIIEFTGGKIFFIIALLGCVTSIIKSIKNPKDYPPEPIIVLTAFLVGSFLISFGAKRFVILCLIPLSISFVLGLEEILRLAEKIKDKKLRLGGQYVAVLIMLLLTIGPIRYVQASMESLLNPIFNDTWKNSLTMLKHKSPENSIVNTWWTPGHFVKAIAKRRVSFDGATINFPQAYWMSRFYLSQSEEEALGIIRMLNNSANQAAEYLQRLGFDLSTSVAMLQQVTKLPEQNARTLLSRAIKDKSKVDHLLTLTHATPPPSYTLVFNELVEKNLQLSFIGRWNFKRIEEINANPELVAKVPKRNSPEYIDFLWDLAGGPTKYSGILSTVSKNGPEVLFEENVTANLESMDIRVLSKHYGQGVPRSIFYLENGKIIEKKNPNGNLNYSAILFKNNNDYGVVLTDRYIANSILAKLYFFKGAGLKYFQPLIEEKDLTQRTQIYIYKIDWERLAQGNIKI